MKQWPINHLTADDLDAFHSASLTDSVRLHLEECEECRSMALLDRRILDALDSLPSYSPSPKFAEQVLARVRGPLPGVVRLLRTQTPATSRKIALAAMVVVSLGASIVWSLVNRDLLLWWINTTAAESARTIWLGVRVVATNLTAQPWYAPVSEFVSSPGRLVALLSGMAVGYGVALVTLRRLLTPPRRPAPHAFG